MGNGIDGKTLDIVNAMAVISNDLNQMKRNGKKKVNQIMMSENGQMQGGFLGTLLASISIPMILKALTWQGVHNMPVGGYKQHRNKIPIPNSHPVIKQPEGTALVNKWQPYNSPPFYDEHDIKGVKGYGVINEKIKGRRDFIRKFKKNPLKDIPLLNIIF